jgi:deazaflavin-dependent oxidoreductase (nitroreductase family)
MTTIDRPDANRVATDRAGSDRARTGAEAHDVPLDWFTRNVFNPIVARLTRWGVSLWGSRVLSVPGRVSGEIRSTPVNLLDVAGRRYLVAPRGETQWVRNVRAAGECTLRVGRRTEAVRLEELTDDDKPAVLRPYLRRWKWEVGQFFGGVDADSTDAELVAIAPNHPVFEVHSI